MALQGEYTNESMEPRAISRAQQINEPDGQGSDGAKNPAPAAPHDPSATIRRWLETLDALAQGGVIEVAGFPAIGQAPPDHVGYFDDYEDAAKAIARLDAQGDQNIFVTLNPAIKDLMARGNNKVKRASFKVKLNFCKTRDERVKFELSR